MSTWEERMAAKHRARIMRDVEAKRRVWLGEAFLPFYPPDDEEHLRWGFEPAVEIMPEIIAANCLGIVYGDPGPPLEATGAGSAGVSVTCGWGTAGGCSTRAGR